MVGGGLALVHSPFAAEVREFLKTSELTETRAFVREIEVSPSNAAVRYPIPMPEDSRFGGQSYWRRADAAEVAPPAPVLSTSKMVGRVGIEPTTPGLKVRCSAS